MASTVHTRLVHLCCRPLEHASAAQPLHGPAPGTSAPDQPQDVQQLSSGAGLPAHAAAAQQLPLSLASHTPADASMGEADNANQQPIGPATKSNARGVPGTHSETGKRSSQQRILPEKYLQASYYCFFSLTYSCFPVSRLECKSAEPWLRSSESSICYPRSSPAPPCGPADPRTALLRGACGTC